MSKVLTARAQRDAIQAARRMRALDKAGIDPRDIGKVFNRSNGGSRNGGPAVDDKDIENVKIPTDAAGLAELFNDQNKLVKILTNQRTATEFVRNYAQSVMDHDKSIATQVREQVQVILHDYFEENAPEVMNKLDMRTLHNLPQAPGRTAHGASYNPRAMGAVLDGDFRDSGDFFQTIWHNTNKTVEVQNKLTKVRNAFSSTVPSEGGFLIPETLRSEMLRVALETAIVRPRARVIPMETLRVPFPAIDSTSNVSSVFGGVVAYWTEEGAALTASSAAFNRIVLDAKKLTAYTEVPNELLSDSIGSFMAFIDDIFPEALGWYEDLAFLKGTGVGEPLGMLNVNNPATIAVAKETGQASGTVVWENVIKMFARMLPGSLGRAVWICSIDAFPELATMALNVGTGGSAVWLNSGASGPPATILGRPVILTEKTPASVGTVGDISFVDPSMYLIGDRQVMSAKSSEDYKFGNDVTAYRIIERVDGRPWLQSAITPQNNGNTLSPFVQLATR